MSINFLSISETISLEIRQKKETSSEDEGQQESGYLAGCQRIKVGYDCECTEEMTLCIFESALKNVKIVML